MCHPFYKTFQFLGNNWREVVPLPVQHPWGHTIEIFGIESGRSCEEHVICGSVLQDDVVV